MNIVIAGISGFLGSRLKSFFQKKRYKVFDFKKKLPKKIDIIINVAGPNSKYCSENAKRGISERLKINNQILKIVKKNKIKKYFYISSIHVYKKQILIDEKSRLNHNNAYSNSHLLSEKFILEKFRNICEIKILRLSNCFGYCENLISDSWSLVINDIIKNIFIKNKIFIKSTKNFKKDFIPISYFLFTIEYLIKKSLQDKIINITSENPQSIFEICKNIRALFKKIYKKEIKIVKNFKKKDRNFNIKSKIMNKKNFEKLKKYYVKDLKELIIFSKKNF